MLMVQKEEQFGLVLEVAARNEFGCLDKTWLLKLAAMRMVALPPSATLLDRLLGMVLGILKCGMDTCLRIIRNRLAQPPRRKVQTCVNL